MYNASYSWSGPQLPKGCECIGVLSPVHIKDPRVLFEKGRGQPQEFLSFVSLLDGSVLYSRTVWKNSYAEHEVTGKTYN